MTPFPDPCTWSSREPTPVIDTTCTAIPNRRRTTDIPVRLFGGYDPRTFAENAIFVKMKLKKTYGLIAIALLVFVCLNFRLMRVEKLEIVDVDVNDWLEEVVNKEKARSASSSLFIHTRCLTRKNIKPIID